MRICLLVALLVQLPCFAVADDTPAFERWESAIAAFEQQDREQPPQPGGVLFIGSSSIRRWDLDASFPDLHAVNRGFGGSQVADSVHFADRIVFPHRPRIIVMYAGDNDLAAGKTPCRVHEDFQAFVAKVRAELPEAKVVFIAIKPSLKRWNLIHRVRAANALVSATCVEDPLLTFVDVDAPMLGADGQPRPELFVSDGLHLSEQGYEIWADLLRPHLQATAE